MTIIPGPEPSCRTESIIVAVFSAVVFIWACWGFSLSRIMRRIMGVAAIAVLLLSCFFVAYPSDSERDSLLYDVRRKWALFRDPNILKYAADSCPTYKALSLNPSETGIVVTSYTDTDFDVTLDAKGRVAIWDVSINRRRLTDVIEGRRLRGLTRFRTYVWIDRHAPIEFQEKLLDILVEAKCQPIYAVGVKTSPDGKTEYVADELYSEDGLKMTPDP